MSDAEPGPPSKPNLKVWLERFLPFELPSIPLATTALNLDRALARLVGAGGRNLEARIERSTARIAARSSAEVGFIRSGEGLAIARATDGDLSERAIEYALGDAVEKQKNREAIAQIAIEDLRATPPIEDATEEIAHDWLNKYSDLAGSKSEPEVQQLWGRILGGEIRKPGSYSLRTLDLLASYDRIDAENISNLLCYAFNGEFIFCWEDGGSVPHKLLSSGDETGVLVGTSVPIQQSKGLQPGQVSGFDGQDRWIRITTIEPRTATYYAYQLSRPGRELARLIGHQTMPESYFMAFARCLKSHGFIVQVSRRGPKEPNGNIPLFDQILL